MIDKNAINIVRKDQESDVKYWLSKSYAERLEALEQIRKDYIKWKYGNDPGFQRVYKIVKRSQS
jgi:hypothetical protein